MSGSPLQLTPSELCTMANGAFADESRCRPHLTGGGRGSSMGCNLGFGCVRLNGSGTVCLRAAEAAFVVPVNFAASASDA